VLLIGDFPSSDLPGDYSFKNVTTLHKQESTVLKLVQPILVCIAAIHVSSAFAASQNDWGACNTSLEHPEIGEAAGSLILDAGREIAQLKREVAKLKAERDILKKAAAYFAKEST